MVYDDNGLLGRKWGAFNRSFSSTAQRSIKSSASQFGFNSTTVDTRILTEVKKSRCKAKQDIIGSMVWPKVPWWWWWWWNKWYEMRGTHFPPLHRGVRCAVLDLALIHRQQNWWLWYCVMNQIARPVTLLDSVEIMRVNREAHWQSWEL